MNRLRYWIGMIALAIVGLLFTSLLGVLLYLNSSLPPVERLENPDYALPTEVYDRNGQKVTEIFIVRRKLVKLEQIPAHLINGLVAKEDSRFYDHKGIDPLRMMKAAWINTLKGRKDQGASTLTQQTARQFFLTLERTWVRKLKEILLALKIEREFTKDEILTLYLNKVNFGDAWGVAAAAEFYFDKPVEELTLAESSLLVGLLPAPNRYKPTRNPHLARQQRNIVLLRMADEGFITRTQQLAASSEPILLAERKDPSLDSVAYYVELVRRLIQEKYGSKDLYEGGLKVYTAMDINYQIAAHKALVDGVHELDRRQGFRGAIEKIELDEHKQVPEDVLTDLNPPQTVRVGRISKGIVTEVSDTEARVALGTSVEGVIPWELLKNQWQQWIDPEDESKVYPITRPADILAPGDLVQVIPTWLDPETGEFSLDLYQNPQTNGALYAMNPQTGEVLAMVGGLRYGRLEGASEFIRATQAERQPGSAFKPIVYAAAIDEGYTPATILEDSPRVFTLSSGRKHIPKNYDETYLGTVTLRDSLARSRNVPSVQLVAEIGPRKVIDYARKLGITTHIPEESIIALGTHSVKLDELTRAYGVFAAGGKLAKPIYIRRIEDAQGNLIVQNEPEMEQVISDATAYLVADILQDVVRSPIGTAYRVMSDLGRPAAGKTGTTQGYSDAWFVGFIPQIAAGIYVGFDDPGRTLGHAESGGRAAAPIWRNFMVDVQRSLPIEAFKQPATVVAQRVDPSGQFVSPCDAGTGSRMEFFKDESIPLRFRNADGCGAAAMPGYRPVAPPTGGGGRTAPEEGGGEDDRL